MRITDDFRRVILWRGGGGRIIGIEAVEATLSWRMVLNKRNW